MAPGVTEVEQAALGLIELVGFDEPLLHCQGGVQQLSKLLILPVAAEHGR